MKWKWDPQGSQLPVKLVRVLWFVNLLALLCFVVLAVVFLLYEVYDLGVMLVCVSGLSALNNYHLWKRLRASR